MNRLHCTIIFLSFFIINCGYKNEIQSRFLLSEKRVERTIAGGQVDTFFINLAANRFIFASLFQMDIDVAVRILGTQNEILQEIDDLQDGPEFISFTTTRPGDYKIIVQPFNPMAAEGRYSLGLEKNVQTGGTNNELICQRFAEFDNNYRAGAAVAIVESGNTVYENGFGLASIDDKTPIRSSTRLNICSIGKQFTAFAIALLEQQDKLSIDDDIHKYLPGLPDFKSKITIGNLLNHSSGLREIADLLELSGTRSGGPFSKATVMQLISKQQELNFKPGSEYLYCNTGYILLAEIIEKITDKSYIEWITDNIFRPLDMKDTYFYHDPDSFITGFAWSYTLGPAGNYQKEKLYKTWYVGAGNVFSTVEDMAKWLINFDYPRVGNAQIMSRLKTNRIAMDQDSINYYTFGMVAGKYKGLDYYWHGGGGYGYTAQILHFPEYKFGAVVLSNFIYSNVYGRARQMADIFLGGHFNPAGGGITPPDACRPVRPDDRTLSGLPGKYLSYAGLVISITREAAGLFIASPFQDKVELYALSDSTFFIKGNDMKFSFRRNGSGRIVALISEQHGKKEIIRRIDRDPDEFRALEDYTGRYYSEELNTTYQIRQVENYLLAWHELNGTIRLTRVAGDQFKGDCWYFTRIDFIPSANSEIIEFKVSNERVRNIRFKKE